jgi:methionyl aminopeptidase
VRNSGLQQHVRKKFQPNTAVCIEPMIFRGENNKVKVAPDGWTVISVDGALSAHYENTVLITANGIEVLTNSDEN